MMRKTVYGCYQDIWVEYEKLEQFRLYRCVVTNAEGKVNSNTAALNLK